jgi:RNA polymerase sigma factor (sigma-70 family)
VIGAGHTRLRAHAEPCEERTQDESALSDDGLPWRSVEEFYRQTQGGLVVRLFYLLSSRQDAEDIVHDAFIQAARKWHTLRSVEAAAATSWLNRIAVNMALNKLRQRRRSREVILGELADHLTIRESLSGQVSPEQALEVSVAMDAQRSLSARQREAYLLKHYFGFDVEDIANHLRRSPSTVRVHLHRAQQAITRKLGGP